MSEPTARLTFWGVRGSTPTVDRINRRYGGNTPCLELTVQPARASFSIAAPDCACWGISGRPRPGGRRSTPIFSSPTTIGSHPGDSVLRAFLRRCQAVSLYGFRSEFLGRDTLKRIFETQMSGPYFPATLGAMPAAREFLEIAGGESIQVRDTRVVTRWLNHPQGCLGFRFETPAGTIAYATDNEPGTPSTRRICANLPPGADIFINDAQYAPGQIGAHRGWGHSTWADGVRMAEMARARQLVLFHHDPESSDEAIDGLLRDARRRFPDTWAATEGMTMAISPGKTEITMPAEAEMHEPEHAPARA